MSLLPNYRPKKLSLGTLEREILEIVWQLETVTVKDVHDKILADPDRELAYTSVTTVLRRLTEKGWLTCYKDRKPGRAFWWKALVSKEQAQALQAYEKLNQFLAISNPDIVAAFADNLDLTSIEQLDKIAAKLKLLRQKRQEEQE